MTENMFERTNDHEVDGQMMTRWDTAVAGAEREMNAAVLKHGRRQTPYGEMANGDKVIILAEEFGEVARACTYDEANVAKLATELEQLSAMALLWRASLPDSVVGRQRQAARDAVG